MRSILDQSLLRIRLRAKRKAAYKGGPIRRETLLKDNVLKRTLKGTLLRNNVLGGTSRTRNVPNIPGTKV